jgi:hypothetical protein
MQMRNEKFFRSQAAITVNVDYLCESSVTISYALLLVVQRDPLCNVKTGRYLIK